MVEVFIETNNWGNCFADKLVRELENLVPACALLLKTKLYDSILW